MQFGRTRKKALAYAIIAMLVATILVIGSNNKAEARPCPNHKIKKNATVTVPKGAVLNGDVVFKNVVINNTPTDITVTQKRIRFDQSAKVTAPYGKGASWVYAGCEGRSKLPTVRYPSARIFKVPPTVDPCSLPAVKIANEATVIVPSGMTLTGDVKADNIPLYDYRPAGVKLIIVNFKQPAQVYAKWGASYIPTQCVKSMPTDTAFVISWPWTPPVTLVTVPPAPTPTLPTSVCLDRNVQKGEVLNLPAGCAVVGDVLSGFKLPDDDASTALVFITDQPGSFTWTFGSGYVATSTKLDEILKNTLSDGRKLQGGRVLHWPSDFPH